MQCAQPHDGRAHRRDQQITAAHAKVVRLHTLENASVAAAVEAADADTATAAVLTPLAGLGVKGLDYATWLRLTPTPSSTSPTTPPPGI